jgi:hypothetical protein
MPIRNFYDSVYFIEVHKVTGKRAIASSVLENVVAQVAKAVLDVENGQINEQTGKLPTPAPGTCPKYLLLRQRNHCGRRLFEGSDYCYWHTQSGDKYSPKSVQNYFGDGSTLGHILASEVAEGRSLESAYLVCAPLGGNLISPGYNLRGGHFERANLSGAVLSYSDLEGVDFSYANLESARLSNCRIAGARFVGARLFGAKLRDNDFSGVSGLTKDSFRGLKWGWLPIYRMLEEYPQQCERMYRKLAAYFSAEGLLDDASWAAYRSCLMRHQLLFKQLSPSQISVTNLVESAMHEKPLTLGREPFRQFGFAWVFAMMAWCRSSLLRIVMGYGEKPLRVVVNAGCAMLSYAVVYFFLGAIDEKTFLASLYFSIVTFTTLGYGDIAPHGYMRLIAASEALVGLLLSGLFIFCLGRRSVGRN